MSRDPTERPLPQNLDAERSVLGAILLDNAGLAAANERLRSSDFFLDQNRCIFHAMLALRQNEQPIDLVTVTEYLATKNEIEAAGGVAYISTLPDGVPRATNVGHYASIVHEKAQLRQLIHESYAIQLEALEGQTKPEELLAKLQLFTQQQSNGRGTLGHKVVSLTDLLTMEVKPVSFVIDPILPHQGIGMIFAWRGVGKTLVSLEIAVAVASGGSIFGIWHVPAPRRVVYVDGEMPLEEIQERFRGIVLGRGMNDAPTREMFDIITPDLQEPDKSANIVSPKGQRLIEDHLRGGELLIFDNLSSLGHAEDSKESEAESWWDVQAWFLRLRRRGISILAVHHAGKNQEQRGTSAREDVMHTVIRLKHPSDYSQAEGFRCEVSFTKVRRFKKEYSNAFYPFELKMETDERGAVVWMRRPLQDVLEQQIAEMLGMGMKPSEIRDETGVERTKIYRIKNKLAGRL